jgi:hypothetical protein
MSESDWVPPFVQISDELMRDSAAEGRKMVEVALLEFMFADHCAVCGEATGEKSYCSCPSE